MRLNPLLWLAVATLLAMLPAASPAQSRPDRVERVQVTDPFIEMRTGPGRGYPIWHVAAREEWIEILLRHTDWYKVRTANGREGWVHRTQLLTTLTESGVQKSFREVLLDDYLRRRLELGAGYGHFKAEPMLKLWTMYKMSDTLSLEATVGQVQGVFSGTEFWHLNLNIEPWSDRRLSPFFGIGFGNFKNIPNQSLVSAITTKAKLADTAIGVRYHLTERFVARADYSIYTAYVADDRTTEYRAWTVGLSFFF